MTGHRITPCMGLRIHHLRVDRGWSYARIARAVGVSKGGVEWYCLTRNIGPVRATPPSPMVMVRGNHRVRRFSAADDAVLDHLYPDFNFAQIGRIMNRPHNSILARVCTRTRRAATVNPVREGAA